MHSWRSGLPIRPILAIALLATTARGDGLTPRGTVADATGAVPIVLAPAPTDVLAGRMIRGRLVDESGRPVPGALVSPEGEWTGDGCRYGGAQTSPVVSDDDGRFVMIVPETLTAVSIGVSAEGFAGTRVPKAIPGGAERSIRVPRGATVTVRIERDGNPCPGLRLAVVQVDREASRHCVGKVPAITDAKGIARFEHLPAADRFCIFSETDPPQTLVIETTLFKAPESGNARSIGAIEAIEPRSLAGRLSIDGGNATPAGTRIRLLRDAAWDTHTVPVATDGTFEALGLAPEGYRLGVVADGLTIDSGRLTWQFVDEQYAAIPLQTSRSDVVIPVIAGTAPGIRVRNDDSRNKLLDGEFVLFDADGARVPLPEQLQGTVVDPEGRPVAGVDVSANLIGRGALVGPRVAETDDAGRFTLDSLPALPLELLAYRTSHQLGFVPYPTRVTVSPGESEVRMVIDPRLPHRYPDLDPPIASLPPQSSMSVTVMRGLVGVMMWWALTFVILPSVMRRLFGNDVFAKIPRTTPSAADGVTRR
ncbi:MAG: carboxypeptidase-like regulatory domain-containing protein [Planctomycetota bacterium]|nr:carboxypeptidase-like regulatory domain-containing protein [Planctomycetota bacterium]